MVEVYPDNLRQLTYYNEWLPSRMSEREDILNTYCEGVTERFRIKTDFLNTLIGHNGDRRLERKFTCL